jgi:hypothetical protein
VATISVRLKGSTPPSTTLHHVYIVMVSSPHCTGSFSFFCSVPDDSHGHGCTNGWRLPEGAPSGPVPLVCRTSGLETMTTRLKRLQYAFSCPSHHSPIKNQPCSDQSSNVPACSLLALLPQAPLSSLGPVTSMHPEARPASPHTAPLAPCSVPTAAHSTR